MPRNKGQGGVGHSRSNCLGGRAVPVGWPSHFQGLFGWQYLHLRENDELDQMMEAISSWTDRADGRIYVTFEGELMERDDSGEGHALG